MASAYQVPTFVPFWDRWASCFGQKYVHMWKNSEIDSKNIFHLAIDIVDNIDHFYFIL
jgi:hypothetical protein